MNKATDRVDFLFRRFSPQKKLEMIEKLGPADLTGISTATFERIVKEAGRYVFPLHKATVDMLMNDEPNPKDDAWWGLVWRKVRIPEADERGYRHYKTVVNNTYIP